MRSIFALGLTLSFFGLGFSTDLSLDAWSEKINWGKKFEFAGDGTILASQTRTPTHSGFKITHVNQGPDVEPITHEVSFVFSSNGTLIKRMGQRRDGIASFSVFYSYDPVGNLRQIQHSHLGKPRASLIYEPFFSKPDGFFTYDYDSQYRVVQENILDSDQNILESNQRQYDLQNNMVRQTYYDSNGNPLSDYIRQFDSSGRLVLETWAGSPKETSWEYDAQGDTVKISKTYGGQASMLDQYEVFEYDEMKNLSKKTTRYNHENTLRRVEVFEYNNRRHLASRQILDHSGNPTHLHKFAYDSNDNLISVFRYDGAGTLLSFDKFEYGAPIVSMEAAPKFSNAPFMQVYPNPFRTSTRIYVQNLEKALSLTVFDAWGRIVKKAKAQHGETFVFSPKDLSNGSYIVKVESEKGKIAKKVVIQN